jgi:SAM-dependent methyltransferase
MESGTVAVYRRHAEEWARRRGPAPDRTGAEFRARVGRGTVVDLGCGPGRYLGQLRRPVVGLDAVPEMLTLARAAGHRAPLVRGDLEHLPFADRSVAGLLAVHSYVHLPKGRAPAAFAEAHRVLRPGGLLHLSVFLGDAEGPDPDDSFPGRFFAHWRPDELTAVLGSVGFEVVGSETVEFPTESDVRVTARRGPVNPGR